MKLSSKIVFFSAALFACGIAKGQQKSFAINAFEKFLVQECRISILSTTSYFLVLDPSQCGRCNQNAVTILSKYSEGKPLYVLCDSNKVVEYKLYIPNNHANFITAFNYNLLKKQIYMRSGIAFAMASSGSIQSIEVINANSLGKYSK